MSTETKQPPQPFKTGTINFIEFSEENEIKFFQDHCWWQGIPAGVKFYPVKIDDSSIQFIGNEHGIMSRHNLPGTYGNGSIHVLKSCLPEEVVKWSIGNIYPSPSSIEESKAPITR
jgi:hypothetical protein